MADLPERPSFFKYAFVNVYNLALLGGVAVASAATADWGLAVIGGGVEALWLVIGADSAPFRRWVERRHRGLLTQQEKEKRKARILALRDKRDRDAAIDLVEAHLVMGRELEKNEHWSGELMREEYLRLESLLDAFIELAAAADRFATYQARFNLEKLRRDLAAQKKLAAGGADAEARALSAQNADLLEKRIGTLEEMGRLEQRTRAQMGVIQNTFSLLRDQMMSLQPPQDVHEQLDQIVAGVSAVRAVLAESHQQMEAPATSASAEQNPNARLRQH